MFERLRRRWRERRLSLDPEWVLEPDPANGVPVWVHVPTNGPALLDAEGKPLPIPADRIVRAE